MLDETKPDAVYICVPPFAHGEIELQLVQRGIPFLVEKPLGTNLDTPRQILHEVKKAGLITSAGYHFRYSDRPSRRLEGRKIGMALGYWMGTCRRWPGGDSRKAPGTIHRANHPYG